MQTLLANVIAGDDIALPDDVALGVKFTRAVLAHAIEADELRAEIERRWGKRAVASLALRITTARIYPIETIAFEVEGGLVTRIYAVRNPDKLAHLAPRA